MNLINLAHVTLLNFFTSLIVAQTTAPVGPAATGLTSSTAKVCNVLSYNYNVSVSGGDLAPALSEAWSDCKNGGTVYIPPGSYGYKTATVLDGGSACAIQLDGVIYRTANLSGNMLIIQNTNNFEFFSANSQGAIQGYGYQYHIQGASVYGPRILRFVNMNNFAIHGFALVDAPQFHLTIATSDNGELYNVIIRGGNKGGLDGVDVWGNNIWVHDVEVTNKDECVTVKSPSNNILVQNVYCNWSGGCAIGSLGAGAAVSGILYQNVYTQNSNQMMLLKSNGGSGYLTNATFQNFIGHRNAYSLWIEQFWSGTSTAAGNGVNFTNLNVQNWTGTEANGNTRGPIVIDCVPSIPCLNVSITPFNMWTEAGTIEKYICKYAQGTGGCLTSTVVSARTVTITSAPPGYMATTMPGEITSGLGISTSIDIPSIPTMFFPNIRALSPLLSSSATSTSSSIPTTTTSFSSSDTATVTSATPMTINQYLGPGNGIYTNQLQVYTDIASAGTFQLVDGALVMGNSTYGASQIVTQGIAAIVTDLVSGDTDRNIITSTFLTSGTQLVYEDIQDFTIAPSNIASFCTYVNGASTGILYATQVAAGASVDFVNGCIPFPMEYSKTYAGIGATRAITTTPETSGQSTMSAQQSTNALTSTNSDTTTTGIISAAP